MNDENLRNLVTEYIKEHEIWYGDSKEKIGVAIKELRKIIENIIYGEDSDSLEELGQIVLESCIENLLKELKETKDFHFHLHSFIGKAKRYIESEFFTDISSYAKPGKVFESESSLHNLVNHLVLEHFRCEGQLDIYKTMLNEIAVNSSSSAGIPSVPFSHDESVMMKVLEALSKRDGQTAINWLKKNFPDQDDLIYELERQEFLRLLRTGERLEALKYARCLTRKLDLITPLMWCLVDGDSEEFSKAYFSDLIWLEMQRRIAKLFAGFDDHLRTIIEAGMKSLPRLIAVRPLLSSPDVFAAAELPVDTETPLRFHSRVVCPTRKVQCTEANPPMRLQCGHVVCKDAAYRSIVNGHNAHYHAGSVSRVSCNYCSKEGSLMDAKCLHL